MNDKYKEFDKAMEREIKAELHEEGITSYPVTCSRCSGLGMVLDRWCQPETCPNCQGIGQYEVEV